MGHPLFVLDVIVTKFSNAKEVVFSNCLHGYVHNDLNNFWDVLSNIYR